MTCNDAERAQAPRRKADAVNMLPTKVVPMKLGFFVLIALNATACAGAGPTTADSNLEVCKRSAAETCKRLFACVSPKALSENVTVLGATERECTGIFSMDCSNNGTCSSDYKYDPAAANECADGLALRTCEDIAMNVVPAACDVTCLPR